MRKKVELVIIAGSAGAFNPILDMVRSLPSGFCCPVLIIIHRRYTVQHDFDYTLSGHSNIPIREISDKEKIQAGVAYLCPPDYHVLIEREKIFSLDKSESLWFSRPSIDITFESAVDVYADKILAILLSGANKDGAEGLLTIKQAGGKTIVQNPAEAKFKIMPESALAINAATQTLTLEEIKKYLLKLNTNCE